MVILQSPTHPLSKQPAAAGDGPEAGTDHVDDPATGRELRRLVDERLAVLLDREAEAWCRIDPDLRLGFDLLRRFIANGGKRMRPAFCFWGFIGAGGEPEDHRVIDLAAAVEMLHTFALVHDDVMDGSDTRRHAPTVHRSLAELHREQGWRGERRRFSEGMAVLIGDLAFVYADRLAAGLPHDVTQLFDEMRVELHVGQYLDLLAAAQGRPDQDRADLVIRYKTAKYSVERPLHLGAALAGGLDELGDGFTEFGLAVGEAFQLRDDLLGAFGDPALTGKPQGDDFREGKQTLLIHLARRWCDEHEPSVGPLLERVGAADLGPSEIDALRDLLEASGARRTVEGRIEELTGRAERVLEGLPLAPDATSALLRLARQSAWRAA
jgi:geranylgeranyl diphosphate synthase, type I